MKNTQHQYCLNANDNQVKFISLIGIKILKKSITINCLGILKFSRSFSNDHDDILLCGGSLDDNVP